MTASNTQPIRINPEKHLSQADVTLYDVVDGSIPAWIDENYRWNGWQVPFFEVEALQTVIEEGSLDPKVARIKFDGDALYLVEMISNELPQDIDMEHIIAQFQGTSKSGVYNLTKGRVEPDSNSETNDILCAVSKYEPCVFVHDGQEKVVYPLGSGWTWEKAEKPQLKM